MAIDHDTIIDGFVVDRGFTDQSKHFNEILTDDDGSVASLNQKSLSYFNKVSVFADDRAPSTRNVNWFAQTAPSLVFDEEIYNSFTGVIDQQDSVVSSSIFRIVDFLLFNYDPTQTRENREDFLISDTDISQIYVPGSFVLSNTLVEGTIYHPGSANETVDVPAYATFSVTLPSGQATRTFVITIYASNAAWLQGYNVSTIVKVIPPLPYSQIYSASLTAATDNIFSTANLSSSLNFTDSSPVLGTIQVSGIKAYPAVLTDAAENTVSITFNVLYKGREPTLTEIRNAIRADLLSSGVGTEEGWEARIPGVFVAGRFYIIPFWDMSFSKANQVVFPSILNYDQMGETANKIMESGGFGDITEYTNIFPVYYNRMTLASVPDLTGVVDIQLLTALIPDYQNFSPQDENYAYMAEATRNFAQQLNTILAIDAGSLPESSIYVPISENLLTFYSFVVEKYEICVITKLCYTTIMESSS